jgi:uncharacterized protein (TIGR03083 family)
VRIGPNGHDPGMDTEQALLDALITESATLRDLAAGDLRAAVPTCPGWDVAAVVEHTGVVQRWTSAVLAAGGERVARRSIAGPADPSVLLAWSAAGTASLAARFEAAVAGGSLDEKVWTFSATGDCSVRWWLRRQAVETTVHRVDVALAAGREPAPADPVVATEGIGEYLVEFLPGAVERAGPVGLQGTLHLHATDAEAEWTVDLDASPVVSSPGHAKADTALRGPVAHLLLWLWNRQPTYRDHLEVFGPDTPLRAWPQLRL